MLPINDGLRIDQVIGKWLRLIVLFDDPKAIMYVTEDCPFYRNGLIKSQEGLLREYQCPFIHGQIRSVPYGDAQSAAEHYERHLPLLGLSVEMMQLAPNPAGYRLEVRIERFAELREQAAVDALFFVDKVGEASPKRLLEAAINRSGMYYGQKILVQLI